MMRQAIEVHLKTGEIRKFAEVRPGFKNSVRYEIGFVVIEDVWGHSIAIHSEDVTEVRTQKEFSTFKT